MRSQNKKPSHRHQNRKAYNWAIYDAIDRCLLNRKNFINGIVYDLGCGEKPYREWLLQYAKGYVGVDWSNSVHELTADVTADLNKRLPIDSEVADTVLSLSVIEHLSKPQNMLNEAYRILRPGGMIILQVPWQWWVHEDPYDFYRFSPYALEDLFHQASFSQVEIEPQAGFFTTVILKVNYFSHRFICGPFWLRSLIYALFSLLWFFDQKCAFYLDKLDRDWMRETSGYFVTARKL